MGFPTSFIFPRTFSHPVAILNIAGPSEARNPGIYLQASALLDLFWSKEHEPI
jgi:hypothetical protein